MKRKKFSLKKQEEKKQHLLKTLAKGFADIEAGRISTQSIDEIFDEAIATRKELEQ